jgi:choline dehydrogenase
MREIIARPAFDHDRGREIRPGKDVCSEAAVDSRVRANAESACHPSCTRKIGAADDPMAVLDAEYRISGIDHLRVVDSSVLPIITHRNLDAPIIMAAEKAADLIKGVEPLPPATAPFEIDQPWEERPALGTPARPIHK